MRVKSLFDLLLKLLGIYYIIQGIMTGPQFIALIAMSSFKLPNFYPLLGSLSATAVFYVLIGAFLISQTHRITSRVIKDNDETVDIHIPTILSVALIVLGGLMIVNEVPNFIIQLTNKYAMPQVNPQDGYWLASVLKIGIGFLLVAYNNRIVRWVESRNKE